MHRSKDSMERGIWKILQNFLETKQGPRKQNKGRVKMLNICSEDRTQKRDIYIYIYTYIYIYIYIYIIRHVTRSHHRQIINKNFLLLEQKKKMDHNDRPPLVAFGLLRLAFSSLFFASLLVIRPLIAGPVFVRCMDLDHVSFLFTILFYIRQQVFVSGFGAINSCLF